MRRRLVVTAAAVLVLILLGALGYIAFVGVKIDPSRSNLTGRWVTDEGVTLNLNAAGTFNASALSQCAGSFYYIVPNPDAGPLPEETVAVDLAEGTWDYGPVSDETSLQALTLRFRSPKAFTAYLSVSKVTWQFHTKTMSIIKLSDEYAEPGTTYCGFATHG